MLHFQVPIGGRVPLLIFRVGWPGYPVPTLPYHICTLPILSLLSVYIWFTLLLSDRIETEHTTQRTSQRTSHNCKHSTGKTFNSAVYTHVSSQIKLNVQSQSADVYCEYLRPADVRFDIFLRPSVIESHNKRLKMVFKRLVLSGCFRAYYSENDVHIIGGMKRGILTQEKC